MEFASMTWQSRWNDNEGACAAISQSGPDVMLITPMGSVRLDLRNDQDIQSFCQQMKISLDLLKKTKADYDSVMLSL